jgi:hypothetical protein
MKMRWQIVLCVVAISLPVAPASDAAELSPQGLELFEQYIRPVLAERCYQCHSARAEKLKGELMLDSREGVLKGGKDGPVLVPGEPDKSKLIEAISYANKDLQMPPKQPLSKEQVEAFKQWVKMGAPDPRTGAAPAPPPAYDYAKERQFWSFQPVKDPPIPQVKHSEGLESPIDAFLEADYESHGLRPARPADTRTLIRRATYDLTGLPPTPQEIDSFLADDSPKAFEKVVDRLLASPHYGEQWGRHWLDVVRYADTAGDNSDFPVPQAYLYRNYVIDAFNKDKRYDQFLREQLAGDLLPVPNRAEGPVPSGAEGAHKDDAERREHIIATGYLPIARRFGSGGSEFNNTIADVIDNVGKGMLGLSLGCARCHDHKFDPVPTTDFYALYGIFDSTRFAFPGTEVLRHPKDLIALGSEQDEKRLQAYDARMSELDKLLRLDKQEKLNVAAKLKTGTNLTEDEKKELEAKLKELDEIVKSAIAEQKEMDTKGPPTQDRAYAVAEGTPHDANIQHKGVLTDLGPTVPRGFLTILGGQHLPPGQTGSGRLELAQWISDPHNPLTARVMANRIWEYHFGKGIVATPNDFGHRGQPPANPALLDYLATRLVDGGWSIKSMHKLIMLSRAYQMADVEDPADSAIDPSNTFQWKFEPRRLSAEEIRDSILADAADLDESVDPGPHPFPPSAQWHYTQHNPFVADYPTNHRSVYLMQQRIRKQPFLSMFDGADTNDTSPARPLSTTSLQALFMMNDPFMHEQAEKLAARLAAARPNADGQIGLAYQLLFARPAGGDELSTGQQYLSAMTSRMQQAAVANPSRAAMASYLRVLLSSNEFIWLD